MIRVLHVVTTMDTGGIETMIMNIYRNIDRDKIQFDFLIHREYESYYESEILSLGGRIYRVPRISLITIASYLKQLKQFFLNHSEYYIIHSHISINSLIVLKVAGSCGNKIKIAHSHEAHKSLKEHKFLRRPIVYFSKKHINKYVDYRFACSEEAGKWLFGRKSNYKVINNSIDSKRYTYSEETRHKIRANLNINNSFTIGHIGNFSKAKNYPFILKVFKEVQKLQTNAKLMLVGDNTKDPTIEKLVKQLGLENNVIFTGVRSDIPQILQAMDVFLFPSLYEGLGIVAVEAQASGLKCIVSNSIPKEVSVTKNLEFISLNESAKYWAERIINYSDGYERGDKIKEIVSAGYDINATTKWLESFYLNQQSKLEG